MAHVLQEFGLPEDIWLMIEEINCKHQYKLVLIHLKQRFQYYWKEKFLDHENRFFIGFTKDRFGNCRKYFTHDMHITRQSERNSSYHMIYNDHFHIVKLQDKQYIPFYFDINRRSSSLIYN